MSSLCEKYRVNPYTYAYTYCHNMCDERYTYVYTYCHNMCDYLSVYVTLSLCHTMERDCLDMWWIDCTDILYKISSMILINIYQSPTLLCSPYMV